MLQMSSSIGKIMKKAILSAVALVAAAITPAHAATKLVLTGEWADVKADHDACARQAALAWCAARAASGKPVTADDLVALEAAINPHMRSKQVTKNHWASYADVVIAGKVFEGNCDNYVFTLLDYMERQGYAMKTVRRALVSNAGTKDLDHMVALVPIKGEWWVFADTTVAAPYRLMDAKWRMLYSSAIDSIQWDITTIQ